MKDKRFVFVAIALVVILLLVSACTSGSSTSPTNRTNTSPAATSPITTTTAPTTATSSPTRQPLQTTPQTPISTGIPTPSATSPAPATPSITPSPVIPQSLPSREVFGQVVSLATGNNSFSVQKDDGSQVTVNADSNTRYFVVSVNSTFLSQITSGLHNMMGWGDMGWSMYLPKASPTPSASATPGTSDRDDDSDGDDDSSRDAFKAQMFGALAQYVKMGTFGDIAVGDLVLVKQSSSSNAAELVVIVKFTGNVKFIQGTVSSVTGNSFSITPATGSAVSLGWDSQSKVMLMGAISVQAGQKVSCIYDSGTNKVIVAVVKTATGASPTPTATSTVTPTSTP